MTGFKFRFLVEDTAGNKLGHWKEPSSPLVLKAATSGMGWYGRHSESAQDKKQKVGPVVTTRSDAVTFCDEDDHRDGLWGNALPSWVKDSNKSRGPAAFGNIPLQ